MMDTEHKGADIVAYFEGEPIGTIESVTVNPANVDKLDGMHLPVFPRSYSGMFTMGKDSWWYGQQRTFKRFGTYTPTARQRELYAKKKKKSRHKKGR